VLARIAAVMVVGLALVAVERAFARLPDQKILRPGFRTDVLHLVLSHSLVQLGLVVAVGLLFGILGGLVHPGFQAAVAAQPAWLQFVEALLVTDLCAYGMHRAAHRVPLLWRFHRVHHSSEHLDWLASARVHPVDIVLVRSAQIAPLFLLGFSRETFGAYAAFISIWAFVLHANVRWRFGPLKWLIATPEFHHWHHAKDVEARDKNFAGQLPLLDVVFGTLHLPERRWPAAYGVEEKVPEGWAAQLAHPFRETM
jgi:sterol desaturase/sphingolipid hydroxylase (fatty acid hydroxylase superfamily)